MEITIIINKADTLEWLKGEEVLAERYAAHISELTGYMVELGSPRGARGHEIVSDNSLTGEQEQEIHDSYMWACDQAANDWSWAE